MSKLFQILVEPATYQKLQKLAVLAGSESAAVERLISHWQSTGGLETPKGQIPKMAMWRSPNGDLLRVGERLEATDGGKTHYAFVEQGGLRLSGKLYESPSSAARAVKEKRGLEGSSANTNGRSFWKLRDPSSNRLIPIGALRPVHKIDSDALLAELE